jgi:HD-GYP domain-containing protein (c-di-GMP phosphodiesterase class II)
MPTDQPPIPGALGGKLLDRLSILAGHAVLFPEIGPACSAGSPVLAALLCTPELSRSVRTCPLDSRGVGIAEPHPGLRLLVVRIRTPMGNSTRGACLLPDPQAPASPQVAALAAAADLDPADVTRELDQHAARLAADLLAAAAADITAVHVKTADLDDFTRQLSESFDTIELLYSMGRLIHNPCAPEEFFNLVADQLHATLNFTWIAVVLGSGRTPIALRGRIITRGPLPCTPSQLRAAGNALRLTGVTASVHTSVPGLGCTGSSQVLAQAIQCKGEVIGLVLAGGKHGSDALISSYDLQLVEAVSGHLGAFTENVALYEDQRGLFMGTVHALTAAIDAKDRYTCGHSERVASLAGTIARAMGLAQHEVERIELAGLVHDVGKIGVPEAVLTKPGRLTAAEFELVQLHPEIGHRILKDIPQLQDILPGVLHHHERWDGKGYPRGIQRDRIPLFARIIAVADTFDAMSSNRSYRPALSREQVLSEIERCAGTQLDPAIASMIRSINLREFDRLLASHAVNRTAA